MTDFNAMTRALVSCDTDQLIHLVKEALGNEVPANDILNKGLIAGMDIVGERMESGDMFIPEVLMAAHAMSDCVTILKPLLAEGEGAASASVLIGTVKGDLHDIGKNLVAMMLESAGMQVTNIGVDIPPEDFVSKIKETNAKIVCLSALLTTTMPMIKQTIVRRDLKMPYSSRFEDVNSSSHFLPGYDLF